MNDLIVSALIAVGSFLLGYAAEKILDSVTGRIKEIGARKKAKKFVSSAEDVVTSGIGVPYFHPVDDVRISDSEKCIFLAPPKSERQRDDIAEFHFKSEDESFCGFSLPNVPEEAFNEALEEIRSEVFYKLIAQRDGLHFNGTKYGILYFNSMKRTSDSSERPILKYELFGTDYYTHSILEKLMYRFRSLLPPVDAQTVNGYDFPVFRTSVGVSLIVVLKKTNQIILTKRAKSSSYSENKEWYYVSVTEAMSGTDFDDYLQTPSIVNCAKRGMLEELNIKANFYDEKTLRIYDTFYETHFLQDGIVMSVELNPDVSFSDIPVKQAKDRVMEVAKIEFVDNTPKAIRSFINKNRDQMRAQTVFALESYAARL